MQPFLFGLAILPCLLASMFAVWMAGRSEKRRGLQAVSHLRQRRVPVDIDAVIQAGKTLERCRLLDISGGGVLAKIAPSLGVGEGDRVRLTFEYESMELEVEARVIHKEKKGPFLCGMQFIQNAEAPSREI